MSYQRLIEEHDAIDQLARALERVAEDDRPDESEAARVLSELATAVSEHLSTEDRRVSRLLAVTPALPEGAAIDFEIAFEQPRTNLQTYLADWTPEMLTCNWTGFKAETAAMTSRLRILVSDETSPIYLIALQKGLICLRSCDAALLSNSQ